MHLIKWTIICVVSLVILLSLIDTFLGKLTLYLLIVFLSTSLIYVRSFLNNRGLYRKLRLPETFFTKSQSEPIDWSDYLPELPSSLAYEAPEYSIDTELATLADKLTENYISSWFKYIGDDPRFVHDVRHIIHAALYKLITVYLPSINVNILISDVVQIINCHLRQIDSGQFECLDRRKQLLAALAHWILSDLGPKELIHLKSIKCSHEQKRDASYHILRRVISHGALANVIDVLAQPQLIISSIMKLVDDTYSRKEEMRKIYLELLDSQSEAAETATAVIPKIVISNTTGNKELTSRQDAEGQEETASSSQQQASKVESNNTSILKTISEKLRLPLSIEHAFSLNRSRANGDQVAEIERGVEVTENSTDLKLISNVRIGDAREITRKGDNFVVYKIVYDGLFEEIESNVNSFKPVSSSIVRKEVVVWHRFSAFVDLHKQLSEDRKMKMYLEKIRSPSKLKTVFESKLEKSITQMRCKFLTEYLNKLCNISVICNSRSFRTFMGYGQDCDEGGNRLPMDASSSQLGARLEKMVSGGFKNVVSAMKKVIPSETYQEGLLASFLSPSVSRRIMVPTMIGDFTDFDDRLRRIQSMDGYCFLFTMKDDSSASYDVTPSPSPLSSSVNSRSGYFSQQNVANNIPNRYKSNKKREDKRSEALIDLLEVLVTQKNQCTWWALTLKVVLTDLLDS